MRDTPSTAVFTLRDLNRQPAKVLDAVRKFGSAEVRTRGGEVFIVAAKQPEAESQRAKKLPNFEARWKKLREAGHVPPPPSENDRINQILAGEGRGMRAYTDAVRSLNSRSGRRAWPYRVTRLLRFEVFNALQRMVFESRTGGPWRVTPESAVMALADFEHDLDEAQFLVSSSLTLEDVQPEYESLVARYTAKNRFRTYDMIHVASARTMGCEKLLTFDEKAKSLAKLAGLKTN